MGQAAREVHGVLPGARRDLEDEAASGQDARQDRQDRGAVAQGGGRVQRVFGQDVGQGVGRGVWHRERTFGQAS
jgi:hypothetical protein